MPNPFDPFQTTLKLTGIFGRLLQTISKAGLVPPERVQRYVVWRGVGSVNPQDDPAPADLCRSHSEPQNGLGDILAYSVEETRGRGPVHDAMIES